MTEIDSCLRRRKYWNYSKTEKSPTVWGPDPTPYHGIMSQLYNG